MQKSEKTNDKLKSFPFKFSSRKITITDSSEYIVINKNFQVLRIKSFFLQYTMIYRLSSKRFQHYDHQTSIKHTFERVPANFWRCRSFFIFFFSDCSVWESNTVLHFNDLTLINLQNVDFARGRWSLAGFDWNKIILVENRVHDHNILHIFFIFSFRSISIQTR